MVILAVHPAHVEQLDEIKELTGEIGMQAKGRFNSTGSRSNGGSWPKSAMDSVSSMGSVVDPAP